MKRKETSQAKAVGSDGTVFRCPQCKAVLPGSDVAMFPFCCERCKLIDLGNWLEGNYKMSRPVDPTDELEDLPRYRPEAKPAGGAGGAGKDAAE